jgi:hypothetical protein
LQRYARALGFRLEIKLIRVRGNGRSNRSQIAAGSR